MFASTYEPVTHDESVCGHGVLAVLCDDCFRHGPSIDPGQEPGGRLAVELQLAGEMPGMLSRTEVLDAIEAAEKQIRWLAGLRTRLLAVFVDRHPADSTTAPPGADGSAAVPSQRWVPDEIGLTLGVSRLEALGEIEQAKRFAHVLPATLAELERGHIDLRRAEAIVRATAVLPDDMARAVEARVLPTAPDATLRQVRDRLRRAIARVDPDGEYRRHKEADRGRRVSIRALDEGMASLWFYGSAADVEAAWQVADRLARALGKEDPRTLDQRRFDLSMEILQGRLTVTNRADLDATVAEVLADHDHDGAGTDDTGVDDDAATATATADGPTADRPDADRSTAERLDAERSTFDGPAADAPDAERSTADGPAADVDCPTLPVDSALPIDSTQADGAAHPVAGLVRTSRDGPPDGRLPTDVLAAAVAEALARRPDLRGVGRKPLVQVVVGIDTLMGSDRHGELVGHGPIDADTARVLASDSVILRLLTDPATGTVLEHGRTHYAPPAALADHVRSRDQICRGPRCTRRVRDLDHHRDWALDGETDWTNLYGFCQHCHQLKDAPGWTCVVDVDDPNGDVVWVSPCGRTTVSSPYDYRDFTDALPDPAGAHVAATVPATAPAGAGSSSDRTDDGAPPF